jgi:Sec-independent protein translocase protein (TatC)
MRSSLTCCLHLRGQSVASWHPSCLAAACSFTWGELAAQPDAHFVSFHAAIPFARCNARGQIDTHKAHNNPHNTHGNTTPHCRLHVRPSPHPVSHLCPHLCSNTPQHRLVFSYEILTPAALNFFVSYAEGAVESLWSIDQYFTFVLVLMLSTGLSFQVGR